MKASTLLKKIDDPRSLCETWQYFVDVPEVTYSHLADTCELIHGGGCPVFLVNIKSHKEVRDALRCLAVFLRREGNYGAGFGLEDSTLADTERPVEALVHTTYLTESRMWVRGYAAFSRWPDGHVPSWELSSAYFLPGARGRGSFAELINSAHTRYGDFTVQHPLSTRMQYLVNKHGKADETVFTPHR